VVLKLSRRLLLATCPLAGLIGAVPALAQPVSKTAPLVSEEIQEYSAEGIDIGGFKLMPEFEYVMYADDNVYAAPDGERSSVVANVLGGLEAKRKLGTVDLSLTAKGGLRRYTALSSENSETGAANVRMSWQPSLTQKLSASAGWTRVVEERGEPEALIPVVGGPALRDPGPRKLNIFETLAGFSQEGGRTLFKADIAWRKFDFLGPANDRRDFESYTSSLTVGRAVGSRFYGTATAYVTKRDFRLLATPLGGNQDETTLGGRLGIATRERGLIEGRLQIGMFRLNPADPLLKSRSGLSADVSLTLRPQRRTAITLDVFSGDVATFRLGASARTDTNISLGVQQEIRHNLYASLGLSYKKVKFFGTTDVEKAIGPRAEVEWIANNTLSLAAYGSFNHRTSNIAEENFDRFRAGVSVRLRY
jgi:hypothetical protein